MPEPMAILDAGEAECVVCRQWPPTLRQAMRFAINVLPLQKPVCCECLKAFWDNINAKAQAKGQRSS